MFSNKYSVINYKSCTTRHDALTPNQMHLSPVCFDHGFMHRVAIKLMAQQQWLETHKAPSVLSPPCQHHTCWIKNVGSRVRGGVPDTGAKPMRQEKLHLPDYQRKKFFNIQHGWMMVGHAFSFIKATFACSGSMKYWYWPASGSLLGNLLNFWKQIWIHVKLVSGRQCCLYNLYLLKINCAFCFCCANMSPFRLGSMQSLFLRVKLIFTVLQWGGGGIQSNCASSPT